MKRLRHLPAFVVLFTALCLISCDTEPVDSELVGNEENENPNPNPSDPNNPGEPGTSTGDYWPMAVNNEWVFLEDGDLNDPMKITGTENINGATYYKINYSFVDAGTDSMTGTADTGLRKNGGEYSMRVSVNVPDQEGIEINVTPYEFIVLKDNLAAGQTWTQSVIQTTTYVGIPMPPIELTINFTGTILEKDVTATVNGVTYDNVIKVKLAQQVNMMGQITNTESVLWYAKNVGPIRSQSTGGGLDILQELDSYVVN